MVWYWLYNFVLTVGFLALLPLLPLIYFLGPRYRDGLGQRFAIYPPAIEDFLRAARPVWIHAASVGEVRAAAPLVRAFKRGAPGRTVLLSTFTATGHRIAAQTEGVDAAIFLPLDFSWIVGRALRRIHPALLVFIETEIWPNLLREASRRGVPTLLLSGRLSSAAFARYARWRPFFRRVLGYFTVFGMQSSEDAARLQSLGADEKRISVVGSLKFSGKQDSAAAAALIAARNPARPLIVAGSTHRGEEEILLRALTLARRRFPRLSLVIAPRHPERFAEVEKLLRASPFDFQRRSGIEPKRFFENDVLLLDTVGELEEFFAAGDIAFVGGSLVDVGGHNILEPARWQKPVLFGPCMSNFAEIAAQMKLAGGAFEVRGADDMAERWIELLADRDLCIRSGKLAAQLAGARDEAFSRNLILAERYL
jgi:3-deoxy-D-manno-octulosonic-acid transferase